MALYNNMIDDPTKTGTPKSPEKVSPLYKSIVKWVKNIPDWDTEDFLILDKMMGADIKIEKKYDLRRPKGTESSTQPPLIGKIKEKESYVPKYENTPEQTTIPGAAPVGGTASQATRGATSAAQTGTTAQKTPKKQEAKQTETKQGTPLLGDVTGGVGLFGAGIDTPWQKDREAFSQALRGTKGQASDTKPDDKPAGEYPPDNESLAYEEMLKRAADREYALGLSSMAANFIAGERMNNALKAPYPEMVNLQKPSFYDPTKMYYDKGVRAVNENAAGANNALSRVGLNEYIPAVTANAMKQIGDMGADAMRSTGELRARYASESANIDNQQEMANTEIANQYKNMVSQIEVARATNDNTMIQGVITNLAKIMGVANSKEYQEMMFDLYKQGKLESAVKGYLSTTMFDKDEVKSEMAEIKKAIAELKKL